MAVEPMNIMGARIIKGYEVDRSCTGGSRSLDQIFGRQFSAVLPRSRCAPPECESSQWPECESSQWPDLILGHRFGAGR